MRTQRDPLGTKAHPQRGEGSTDGPADLELGPPQARITIENVTVKRGQTLTVYLRTAEGQQQVDLRVTSAGVAEIFADDIGTQQFVRWKPLR